MVDSPRRFYSLWPLRRFEPEDGAILNLGTQSRSFTSSAEAEAEGLECWRLPGAHSLIVASRREKGLRRATGVASSQQRPATARVEQEVRSW